MELIKLLNVFGPGLTGSEGIDGRLYRKVTAPFFTEQTMDQVWRTSIDSIGTLMQGMTASQASKSKRSLRSMIAEMTLHNVLTVCFRKNPERESFQFQESIPTGHKMGFRQAVLSALDNMGTIAFTPKLILSRSLFSLSKCFGVK